MGLRAVPGYGQIDTERTEHTRNICDTTWEYHIKWWEHVERMEELSKIIPSKYNPTGKRVPGRLQIRCKHHIFNLIRCYNR
jgi:hypothetical protein